MTMNVKIKKLRANVVLPDYHTSGSAAMDLSASIDEQVVLQPGERMTIPLGFSLALPDGYEAQIRARSGLSSKHGICLANGVGTIDADYRGECGAILINLGTHSFTVEPGMRVAQMIVSRCERITWDEVASLDETERGEGGYGSTGH
jgi:dUTP pyrophosphatase